MDDLIGHPFFPVAALSFTFSGLVLGSALILVTHHAGWRQHAAEVCFPMRAVDIDPGGHTFECAIPVED